MIIKNKSSQKTIADNAWLCKTLKERLKGLMFKKINDNDACVLVSPYESLVDSSIHMMFVPQDLQIIWTDSELRVVSVKKCRKASINPLSWRSYTPSKPARYVIELLDAKGTMKGDKLEFVK